MLYYHGAYGELGQTQARSTLAVSTTPVYIGTLPVHLVRGWKNKGLVHTPIRLNNLIDAQRKVGYSADWASYTLCEAIDAHFANSIRTIGPIYAINVLDPETMVQKNATFTTTMIGGRGEFKSDLAILDSITIEGKIEGTDYEIDYDYAAGKVILRSIGSGLSGDVSAKYDAVKPSAVKASDIIGGVTAGGDLTGLGALRLVYQEQNAVPNLLVAPGWSEQKTVRDAMLAAAQKINGHWDAMCLTDIPMTAATIAEAVQWKRVNGYVSEREKPCWPMARKGENLYHMSTLTAVRMQQTDFDHNGVPYESPSNKPLDVTGFYFGGAATRPFDQEQANTLNENGITTMCYWGGRWVLWGPHTGAFVFGTDYDARAIFDANMRMMFHITNGFQLRHGVDVDRPMTRSFKDSILNDEQEILDGLKTQGALLLGEIYFLESENPISDMMMGDFRFDFLVTSTPPAKSLRAFVSYTDKGFYAYYEKAGDAQ